MGKHRRKIQRNLGMKMEQLGPLDNDELEELFTSSRINADEKYDVPPQIIWVDDSAIATLGNFSASTGKAKSKKTFNISALVAASLTNTKVLNYRANLPENKRKILYIDTEQSHFQCYGIMKRILKLANLPENENCENFWFSGLREYSPSVRLQIIEYALRRDTGYGLVIIDGIRDLMLDINNPSESVNLINKLMRWSSIYNLHIHCVLHLNKGDDNVRGHIGTELSNKAETVLVINKSNLDSAISEVRPLIMRDKEFKPFAFRINELKLPELAKNYKIENGTVKRGRMMIADITIEQHREALVIAFAGKAITGYENVLNALTKGYANVGFRRGRTTISKLFTTLVEKGMLIKQGVNDYAVSNNLFDMDIEYNLFSDQAED